MTVFFVIIGISILGIGFVIFIMSKEKASLPNLESTSSGNINSNLFKSFDESAGLDAIPDSDDSIEIVPKEGGIKKIFSNFGSSKKKSNNLSGDFDGLDDDLNVVPQATPFPSLKQHFEMEKNNKKNTQQEDPAALVQEPFAESGTKSIQTTASPETTSHELPKRELSTANNEINSTNELSDLREKLERSQRILAEKNDLIEKTSVSLENEIKNRKEFNKVKDLLEKELRDTKEQSKILQSEISALRNENEDYKKKIQSSTQTLDLSHLNSKDLKSEEDIDQPDLQEADESNTLDDIPTLEEEKGIPLKEDIFNPKIIPSSDENQL